MNLITRNSKLKKSKKRTFNFGIPAYQASNGLITCPNAGHCIKGCYAKSGAYLFSNVAKAFEARLNITFQDNFVTLMLNELSKKKVERLRIHDSGDFYLTDKDGAINSIRDANVHTHYIDKWISIITLMPHIEFYAYTKMVSLFKRYEKAGVLPLNFTVIYSYGGTEDKLINPVVDRHARVFETTRELKALWYADASKQDDVALELNPRIGLVYHGNKNYENTHWGNVK